jgi:hypothetical protein
LILTLADGADVSVTATRIIWNKSEATGSARLVLLCLAFHVSEEKLKRYGEAWAWPKRATIERETRLSESSVKRALRELQQAGEITCIGERFGGVKEWELTVCGDVALYLEGGQYDPPGVQSDLEGGHADPKGGQYDPQNKKEQVFEKEGTNKVAASAATTTVSTSFEDWDGR